MEKQTILMQCVEGGRKFFRKERENKEKTKK